MKKFNEVYNRIVNEGMENSRLTDKDHMVVKAFAKGEGLASKKLSTDGRSLTSSWTGGTDIANWDEYGKVNMPKKTSRKALEVQNLVKKHVTAGCLKESKEYPEYDWERQGDGLLIRNVDTGKTMFIQGEEASEMEDKLDELLDDKDAEKKIAMYLDEYETQGLFESSRKFELKVITGDDLDKPVDELLISNLKTVKTGTMKELNKWAIDQDFKWREEKSQLFGGYWVDPETGDSYFFDVKAK